MGFGRTIQKDKIDLVALREFGNAADGLALAEGEGVAFAVDRLRRMEFDGLGEEVETMMFIAEGAGYLELEEVG